MFCDTASEPAPDFSDEQTLPCEQCTYTCNTDNKLKTHVSEEHTAGKRLYCELCDFVSPDNATLGVHLEEGHEKSVKITDRNFSLFYCKLCTFCTTKKYDSDYSDERALHCEQCAYTCNTNNELKTHVSEEHTAGNRLCCELCDSASPDNATLGVHLEEDHEKSVKSTVRNFSRFYCELCTFCTTEKCDLEIHVGSQHDPMIIYLSTLSFVLLKPNSI